MPVVGLVALLAALGIGAIALASSSAASVPLISGTEFGPTRTVRWRVVETSDPQLAFGIDAPVFRGELAVDVLGFAPGAFFPDVEGLELASVTEATRNNARLAATPQLEGQIGFDGDGLPPPGPPPEGGRPEPPPLPPAATPPTADPEPFVGPVDPGNTWLRKLHTLGVEIADVPFAPITATRGIEGRLYATPIMEPITATEIEPDFEPNPEPPFTLPGDLRHGDPCGNDHFFMDYVGAMFNGMTCETDETWHRVLVGGDAPDWAEGELHIARDGRTVVAFDGKWWHKKKGEPCPARDLKTRPTRYYGLQPGQTGEHGGFSTTMLTEKVCASTKIAKGASLGNPAWQNVKDCAKQKRRCIFVPFPFNVWDCYMANDPRCD